LLKTEADVEYPANYEGKEIKLMTDNKQFLVCRHYVTYTGVRLPLKLITPLDDDSLDKRITYFRGYYSEQEQLMAVEKVVYDEVEFEHRYQYHADGRLKSAEMREADEEPNVIEFE
jgi:YD repeat-containing protein